MRKIVCLMKKTKIRNKEIKKKKKKKKLRKRKTAPTDSVTDFLLTD
jgi:hypothetical protein